MEHVSKISRKVQRGMLERAHFVGGGVAAALSSAAPIIGAATTLASFFMRKEAMEDAEKRRQEEIRRQFATQGKYEEQSRNEILRNAAQYSAPTRERNLEQGEQRATQSIESVLKEYRPADVGPKIEGKVSDAFLAASAKSEADTLSRAHDFARRLGRLMGYSELATDESARNAVSAGRLASIAGDREAEMRAFKTRLQGIEPDDRPFILSDAATAITNKLAETQPHQFTLTPSARKATSRGNLLPGWTIYGG